MGHSPDLNPQSLNMLWARCDANYIRAVDICKLIETKLAQKNRPPRLAAVTQEQHRNDHTNPVTSITYTLTDMSDSCPHVDEANTFLHAQKSATKLNLLITTVPTSPTSFPHPEIGIRYRESDSKHEARLIHCKRRARPRF